jgi:chromo domain-containing protein 1
VHPDVENFTDIPGFGQVLRRGVRLWSVGLQPGIEYDQASDVPPVLRYDRIEIFPVGGFIYITDEVFETKPQLALLIIKLFLAKAKKLKDLSGPSAQWSEIIENSLIWRLCVRPELMEHLFKYCEDQATELHAGDADVQRFVHHTEISCSIANPPTVAPNSTLFSPTPTSSSRTTQKPHSA